MLRLLIATGLLLMAVGFGAAGWQYWQGLPTTEAASDGADEGDGADDADPAMAATTVPLPQNWLISPTGGLVPRDDVRAYLAQGRFVPSRTATILLTAPLTDLLIQGESLPDLPYLQVLADIRALKAAEGLCPVLTARIAEACAVNAANVVEDSVDPVLGTARFRIELVYWLKPAEVELPDLAAHVLEEDRVALQIEVGTESAATVQAALIATVESGLAACATKPDPQTCRIMGLGLDWSRGTPIAGRSHIGWLETLPDGMFAAPPLDPAPEG